MKAESVFVACVLTLSFFINAPAAAQSATPQQTLNQYVTDLQSNPGDVALRQKIIALARTMRPAPAIPPSAHQDYVMAVTFVESAKDNTGYEHAIDHFKSALLAAPWWMDAYRKLADAQKAAGHYDDAIATLNLYLLGKPADASDAQDEIYKLMALKQAAADDQARKQQEEQQRQMEAQQRQAEEQRRQREEQQRQIEEQQRAYEASPEGRWQALLKKIDGVRFVYRDPEDGRDSALDIAGNRVVFLNMWYRTASSNSLPPGITPGVWYRQSEMSLDGPQFKTATALCPTQFEISEDGEQVTARDCGGHLYAYRPAR